MAEPTEEDTARAALEALQARLDRAAAAAERLLADAGRATAARTPATGPAPEAPPPRGWQRADEDAARRDRWIAQGDAELLLTALGALRERIPPELQRRIAEALRELLLAVRALIDWCLERAERRTAEPPEVQDIPII